MALLELLHKYCAWNCPNEENGCDYVFTEKDRTEYWMHVNNCPFRKSEENNIKVKDVKTKGNRLNEKGRREKVKEYCNVLNLNIIS